MGKALQLHMLSLFVFLSVLLSSSVHFLLFRNWINTLLNEYHHAACPGFGLVRKIILFRERESNGPCAPFPDKFSDPGGGLWVAALTVHPKVAS